MFRLLLSLIYLALTVIGAIVVHLAVTEAAAPVDQGLESRVEVSHMGHNTLRRLRDLQLRDLAAGLAESELEAYLGVLEDNRQPMLKLEAEVYNTHPGDVTDPKLLEARKAFVQTKSEFLDQFATSLADRIEAAKGKAYWETRPRADFESDTKEILTVCSAYSVAQCFFRMSYYPLKDRVDQIRRDNPYGIRPDLVVITDERGTGLANADRPKWSDDSRFAETYPLIRKVREGVITRDVIQLEGNDSYFFVAAAPIFEGDTFRGAILTGVEIDDGLLRGESQILGLKVSYLDGKKLIRSTLSEQQRAELTHNLPPRSEEPSLFKVSTDRFSAQFVPLTGNYSNHDVKAVMVGDRQVVMEPIDTIQTFVPLYGLMMFLIGMALFMWIIRTYTKPLVEIDSGIHEIMNGNHDFEFPSDFQDPLWSSMAKSLNRMVGILLGRDLEDEDLEAYLGVRTRQDTDAER